ncbi:hypothetical protein R3P38DRAFT_3348628 [Favolaschia claudopus]|uniref:F-box domain-containing protein n=1 Tax=Favolaschia claudopus TaxID=2862362 RepID=A0AAW0CUW5_9AGAR
MSESPLDVPELLNQCIDYLGESTSDLLSCAQVARPWIHAAQSRLFRATHVSNRAFPTNDNTISHFCYALNTSPHLLNLVEELDLNLVQYAGPDANSIKMISSLPFTRLGMLKVTLSAKQEKLDAAEPLYSLVNLPSLRFLWLDCYCPPALLMEFLKPCSPVIQHLELTFREELRRTVQPATPHLAWTRPLKSFKLFLCDFDDCVEPAVRLDSALGFLNLSRLGAFSIDAGVSSPWNIIRKPSIKILDMDTIADSAVVDLGDFPNLEFLRMVIYSHLRGFPTMLLPTLRTSAQCKHLHTIVISLAAPFKLAPANCTELDSVLTSLSLASLSVVEFEQRDNPGNDSDSNQVTEFNSKLSKALPLLCARNLLRTASRSDVSMESRWQYFETKLSPQELVNTL